MLENALLNLFVEMLPYRKKHVVTSLDACRTQFYLQPLAPGCAKSSQLELAQSWGTRRHTGVTPVTRRGCKVAVPWQKSGFSHGCWRVIFLQGLLLCISDGREQPSVGGQRFTAGTLSIATWGSGRCQSFSAAACRAERISDSVQGHQQDPVLVLTALRSF